MARSTIALTIPKGCTVFSTRRLKGSVVFSKRWVDSESTPSCFERAIFTEGLAGIYYRSKYGHDIENWALFEPFQIDAKNSEPIRADDPDFERALQLHGLKFRE